MLKSKHSIFCSLSLSTDVNCLTGFSDSKFNETIEFKVVTLVFVFSASCIDQCMVCLVAEQQTRP